VSTTDVNAFPGKEPEEAGLLDAYVDRTIKARQVPGNRRVR